MTSPTDDTTGDSDRLPCAFPWNHLFVDPVGTFSTCCVGDPRPEYDEEGRIICAGQENGILRHWHSARMREVRRSLATGKKTPVCKVCWRVEDAGSISYRYRANQMYPDACGSADEAPKPRLEFIDLRLGNLCNLRCRMCIPYSSKLLVPEHRELQVATDEFWGNLSNLSWLESDTFWDDLLQYSSDFRRVHLAGGEPLVIDRAWQFLRRLVEKGCSKDIELAYNSNWTIIPAYAGEIWSQFKSVHLFLSLDAVGRANELIRHPSNWQKVRANIALLEEQHAALNVHNASIHATAQVYNIFSLVELCEFVRTLKFIQPYPQIAPVVHPEVFDIQVLPAGLKERATRQISEYIETINKRDPENGTTGLKELTTQLSEVIVHMNAADHTHLIPRLRTYNEVFDSHRREHAADVLPHLDEIFS